MVGLIYLDICKELGNKTAWEIGSWNWGKKERVLQELVAGEELAKEVTRIYTEGISVPEEARLSRTGLEDNLVWHFWCQRGLRQESREL